ncbi:MAG: outer membrane beta-barrel protein [Gemmatimonadota bacterium]
MRARPWFLLCAGALAALAPTSSPAAQQPGEPGATPGVPERPGAPEEGRPGEAGGGPAVRDTVPSPAGAGVERDPLEPLLDPRGARRDSVGAALGRGGLGPGARDSLPGGGADLTDPEAGAAQGVQGGAAPDPYVLSAERARLREFRLGPGVSALAWEDDAPADDGLLAGLAVERDVASFLAVRASLGYGTTELTDAAGETTADTRLYLPEVTAVLQLALGPFAESPVVPYGLVGFASLISDPDRAGFSTRSQNAFGYGAGARLRLGPRLGVLGEVERHLIKLEDVFDAAERGSRSVHATRFGGSLTYAF